MIIGVLAIQKGYAKHIKMLSRQGFFCIKIKHRGDLANVQGLVIPHGNLSTLLYRLHALGFADEIARRAKHKKHPLVLFGLGSGAAVLAKKLITASEYKSLGIVDMVVTEGLSARLKPIQKDVHIDGIMAPMLVTLWPSLAITSAGKHVETIALYQQKEIVGVRSDTVFATLFDPVDAFNLHVLFGMTVAMKTDLADYL